MPCFNFFIDEQTLSVKKDFTHPIYAKTVNYFEFTVQWKQGSSWNNEELNYRYAEFLQGNNRILIEVSESMIDPLKKYYIPWEVLDIPGFSVSFFAVDVELALENLKPGVFKRLTTNSYKEKIYPTGRIDGEFKEASSTKQELDTDEAVEIVCDMILPIQKEKTDFILKNGPFYEFDTSLTYTINRLIDDKIGKLINADL
jgi:hypothetical protein